MIKLVISDLDGTLLNSKKELSIENVNTIRQLIKKGVNFCICTGRIYKSAYLIAEEIGFNFPIISCNGAYVKNPITGEVLFNHTFEEGLALEIISIFQKYDLTYHFYDEDTVYSNKYERSAKSFGDKFKNLTNKPINVAVSEDLSGYVKKAKAVNKFIGFKNKDKDVEGCLSELKKIKEIDISQSGSDNIEIMGKNISKGSAVNHIMKIYGLSEDEVMTLGDEMNDVTMFTEVKYSVAMGNAIDDLKERAYYTTKSNDDDGVSYAIKKFIIEKEG